MTSETKPSLLDTPFDHWPSIMESLGEAPYRAQQLADGIFKKRAKDFQGLSTFPVPLREKLADKFSLRTLKLDNISISKLDGTTRYFFKTSDDEAVSCVYLPYGSRRSICLSTQVGCAWGCVFCASGRVKFQRNLLASEIVDQIFIIEEAQGERLQSLLFMGMGEPLSNYKELVGALRIIRSKLGLDIGGRHVTVSTCGLVPQIELLAKEGLKVNLAISLHAANDELRKEILPKSSKWTIKELLHAAKTYSKTTGAGVTFEYILLGGINDTDQDAKRLSNLLRGFVHYGDYYVNLIAYNPVPGLKYRPPDEKSVEHFKEVLTERRVPVRLRKPQGVDIGAGCGQLGEGVR